MMYPVTGHPAIERFRSSSNPCIFVGAGISYKHPTNIPLFSGLRDSYLDAIDPDRSILKRYTGGDSARFEASIRELELEKFFSDLLTSLGPIIFAPFKWMNNRPLNVYHYLIRRIVNSLGIDTVLTTNFDTLLERVLPGFYPLSSMKYGFRRSVELFGIPKHHKQDIYPFDRPAIIYLHGRAGTDDIDITVRSTSLPYDRFDYANLTERLHGATLLVIGYGGGDTIDIVPFLSCFDIMELIWVRHSKRKEIQKGEVPELWLKRVTPNAVGILCRTEILLSMLSDDPELREDQPVPESFTDAISACLEKKLTQSNRHYLLSSLLNATGHGDIALSILDACPEFSENQSGVDGLAAKRARAISMSRSSNSEHRVQAKLYLKEAINVIPSLLPENFQPSEINDRMHFVARECGLAYESLGILYYEAGDIEESIRCCERARKLFYDEEDKFRLNINLIVFYQERSLSDIVGKENAIRISDYENFVYSDAPEGVRKEIARFLSQMGELIYKKEKNLRHSLRLYELSLQYDPLTIEVYIDVSSLQYVMGDIEGAMAAIEKGISINNSHYKLLCNKGFLLNASGRQREAKAVLMQAIEINDEDPLTWNNLGINHHELGELEEAKNAYIKAVILDPSLKEARFNIEKVQWLLNKGSINDQVGPNSYLLTK